MRWSSLFLLWNSAHLHQLFVICFWLPPSVIKQTVKMMTVTCGTQIRNSWSWTYCTKIMESKTLHLTFPSNFILSTVLQRVGNSESAQSAANDYLPHLLVVSPENVNYLFTCTPRDFNHNLHHDSDGQLQVVYLQRIVGLSSKIQVTSSLSQVQQLYSIWDLREKSSTYYSSTQLNPFPRTATWTLRDSRLRTVDYPRLQWLHAFCL